MTMREFGEKYNGNIQAALRGVQKEKFKASGAGEGMGEIDKSTRKRKWIASQETDGDGNGGAERDGNARASKNGKCLSITLSYSLIVECNIARMMQQSLSPKKRPGSSTGPGTAQHARLMGTKTPGKVSQPTLHPESSNNPSSSTQSRTLSIIPGSPSPQKPSHVKPSIVRSTSTQSTFTNPRPNLPRPLSPSKSSFGLIPNSRPPANYNPNAGAPRSRVPSSSTFNPSLPPEAPGYPGAGLARMPRMDEKMLSINGSPLANPLLFPQGPIEGLPSSGVEGKTLKRTNSTIAIRPDPLFALRDGSKQGIHSRSNSQLSFHPPSTTHSRNNSEVTLISPSETQTFDDVVPSTPEMRHSTITRAYSVTIATKDGHILEFDPLQTSPSALDALEGITDSAKKQAREEMGRLVQAAVDKWKVG
ncbi:hypothetical protein VNI00_002454 [Paramarasmius palmivorus]|uniref:Uncharacterized protein n=1 Tax=Paramarasmius palmivorus TaxID=297713 RepID=A0AAW0DYU2_9AGAR